MRVRLVSTIAALTALALIPSAAMAGSPKAKLRFASTSFAVAENAGTASVTVTRVPRNNKSKSTLNTSVSVAYATANGTATAGVDYTATHGRLSFPACGSSPKSTDPCMRQTITVPIADDSVVDGNKTVRLSLASPSRNAVVVNPQKTTLTIADNEGPNQITFDAPDYSVWELGPAVEIHVIRSGAGITGSATVDFSTHDGTATAPGDYTSTSKTVSFAPGEVDQQVLVPITDDAVVEPTETFGVSLANATGGAAVVTPSETVTIQDDDTVTPAHVLFDQTSYSVGEGGDVTVTVNRTTSVDTAVSVDYATVAQTALAGTDFAATSDTLSFDPGDTSQSFTISTYGDSLHEGDETFGVNLANPIPSNTVVDAGSSTVTIADDDPVPTISAGQSTSSGGTVTFVVELSNPTTSDVTVTYVITDSSGNQVGTGTATVPAGSTSTTVQVPVGGTGPYTTTLSNPTGGTLDSSASNTATSAGGGASLPTVSVSPSQGGTPSGDGSTTSFDVTLSSPTDHPVVVDYEIQNGSGTTVGTGSVTIPAGSTTVTVTAPLPGDTQGPVTVVIDGAAGATVSSTGGSTSVPVSSGGAGASTGGGSSATTGGSTTTTGGSTGSGSGSPSTGTTDGSTTSAADAGTSGAADSSTAVASAATTTSTGSTAPANSTSAVAKQQAAATSEDMQMLLGARLSACKLTVRASKWVDQRHGILKLSLRSGRDCVVTTGASAMHRSKRAMSTRLASALKTRRQTIRLRARHTQTVQLRFTRRGLSFIKRAIQAGRPLTLTLVVIERDSSKHVTKRTARTRLRMR